MSSSDDDAPLVMRRRQGSRTAVDSSDDDVPLVMRHGSGPSKAMDSSDDDVPLVTRRAPARPAASTASGSSSRLKKKVAAVRSAKGKEIAKKKSQKAKEKADKDRVKALKKAQREKTGKAAAKPATKFELPGQRKDAPPENDPLRLFYESMYNEKLALKKKSDLAEGWMLRHGLLDATKARTVSTRIAKAKKSLA